MLLVRLLVFLVLAGIGLNLLAYFLTRQQKYWRYANSIMRFAVILAALFLTFFVLERVILR